MGTLVAVFCILGGFVLSESAKEQQHRLDLQLMEAKAKKKSGERTGQQEGAYAGEQ